MLQHLLVWSVATAWSICYMLQLLYLDFHTNGESSALQFNTLPLEKVVCDFSPSPLLPKWYVWLVVWDFYAGLQFNFQQLHQRQLWNSESPMGFHQTHLYLFLQKIVKLQMCSVSGLLNQLWIFLFQFYNTWIFFSWMLSNILSRLLNWASSSSTVILFLFVKRRYSNILHYLFFIWISYIQTNRTKKLQPQGQETPGYK